MGGHELEFDFGPCAIDPETQQAAANYVDRWIAAEHPQLTAAELAADPHITADKRDLLAALGLNKEQP
ncbi:hypothetical protein [Streptomyces chartreusis]|uniref:hypothetical protein n=1 Tax=Streptomyces chartreusis TaxID=1969 RepID=UPI00123CC047|nr:hypothetical protein [Streptomyces chartreusis]QEV66275.1 hypothetical protein CP983_06065 [Streptomyces chartreusis]GGW99175.1 hypothetical protein GCM10010321_12080 [Streptomyces chartreusis]